MPTWIEQPHDQFFDRLTDAPSGSDAYATEPERDVLEWRKAGVAIARIEYPLRFERKAFYLEQTFLNERNYPHA
jgi:hypothetical protein